MFKLVRVDRKFSAGPRFFSRPATVGEATLNSKHVPIDPVIVESVVGGIACGACRIANGEITKLKGAQEIVMRPAGTWGLERPVHKGPDMKKYEIAPDGTVTTSDFPLTGSTP